MQLILVYSFSSVLDNDKTKITVANRVTATHSMKRANSKVKANSFVDKRAGKKLLKIKGLVILLSCQRRITS